MAWTSATTQATVEAARQSLIAATKAIESYILVNNPALLAQANTALTTAKTAITTLQT